MSEQEPGERTYFGTEEQSRYLLETTSQIYGNIVKVVEHYYPDDAGAIAYSTTSTELHSLFNMRERERERHELQPHSGSDGSPLYRPLRIGGAVLTLDNRLIVGTIHGYTVSGIRPGEVYASKIGKNRTGRFVIDLAIESRKHGVRVQKTKAYPNIQLPLTDDDVEVVDTIDESLDTLNQLYAELLKERPDGTKELMDSALRFHTDITGTECLN